MMANSDVSRLAMRTQLLPPRAAEWRRLPPTGGSNPRSRPTNSVDICPERAARARHQLRAAQRSSEPTEPTSRPVRSSLGLIGHRLRADLLEIAVSARIE